MNIKLPTEASFENKERKKIYSDQEGLVRVKNIINNYLVIANTDADSSSSRQIEKRSRIISYINGKPNKPYPLTSELTLREFRELNNITISIKFLDDLNGQVIENEDEW